MITKIFLGRLSRTFFAGLVACLFIGTATTAAHAACATDEIDVLGDGTQCEKSKFEITTTNDTNEFIFNIAATGVFYVDWGDGVVDVITRSDGNPTEYSHSYSGTGSYTIRFGGLATGYPRGYSIPVIVFYKESGGTMDKIASLSGSLGAIFPSKKVSGVWGPYFNSTFRGATSLTTIPVTLFSGLTDGMFNSTFKECTALREIPTGLFDNIGSGSPEQFRETFKGCTSLTEIPAGLFDGLNTMGGWIYGMFAGTFADCRSLTTLPSGLFNNINTNTATRTDRMFHSTFKGCTNITSIPSNLFSSNLSIASGCSGDNNCLMSSMFEETFYNTNITAIPTGLFNGIDTSNATDTHMMFRNTFENTPITSIPSGLFSSIDTGNSTNTAGMFNSTFYGTNITSIPIGLFDSIDTSNSTVTNNMFISTFRNTNISAIPNGLFDSIDTSNSTDAGYMFESTFNNTNISAIPNGLFDSIDTSNSTVTNNMFANTFKECTSVTSIPSGLFDSVDTSSATNTSMMFNSTFYGTNITSIPAGLFSGIDTSSATDTSNMFTNTFNDCKSLTSIPSGLFDSIDTSSVPIVNDMFRGTFYGTNITSIPSGLFDSIDTSSATNTRKMFYQTFYGTQITSIPSDLFSGIDTSSATNTSEMFYDTFKGCTSLTGYIPPTAFPNTITPGSSSSSSMWYRTFAGTNLLTACPAGTVEYNTGFQNDWGYSNSNTTTSGTYRVSCEPCTNTLPENATWAIGTCNWNCNNGFTENNGVCIVTTCTGANYYTTAGASGCAPCPDGYDYNTESGKTSISQCQIQCPAGTYVDGGPMYTQLEYIETTGTQYIDTGLVPANLVGPVVRTTLQYTSTARSQQNGIRNVNSMYLMFGTSGTSDRFVIQGSGGGTETLFGVPDTNKHTFVIDTLNRTCAIDNDVRALNVGDLSKLTKSIYIGNANGQSRANYAKYYNVNIISDDVVVMNLIPARRDSDNGIGMYDTVTGAFFPNVGTGDFGAGPDVGALSGVCVNVGTGYWAAESVTNYGNVGSRNACTDVGDGSYTNSDVGAAANTDCYKTCTVAVANIAHALTVNGNDYYGGANTCSVATCENGYHVDNNACVGNTITVNWSNASAADIAANNAGTVTYGDDIRTPRAATIIPGKVFLGWKFSAPEPLAQ